MFDENSKDCNIKPPLYTNFGGAHLHFGKGVYANFNPTPVNDTHISVGDYAMIGPNVTIATDDLWLECDFWADIEMYEKYFGDLL